MNKVLTPLKISGIVSFLKQWHSNGVKEKIILLDNYPYGFSYENDSHNYNLQGE